MTQEELDSLMGLDTREASKAAKTLTLGDSSRHGGKRHLMEVARNVDHFNDGYMHSVKNQGGCGSCWAFAANTALEGTLAKKTDSDPVRISEQQLVDCTYTLDPDNEAFFGKDYKAYGCQGGWMSWAWDFQIDQGNMTDADYPYTSGNTGTETKCAHNYEAIEHYTHSYGQITTNTDDMKRKLMDQPLTVALNASSSAFQFYSSGVVTEADGCSTSLNHAVVLVGYTDDDGDNNDDDDNDDNDNNDNDDDDDNEPTPTSDCVVEKWWHECDNVQSGRRRMNRANENNNYWKVQNSWGTWWGDEGFILIEISGGAGVCGIN